MADFETPFGNNSGRRLPTEDERINGFPCGPADQTLFNGLFHRIESELGSLISYAGLVPSDGDFSQVRKAVEALISTATGGGDTSQFLLMSQATARLPIYPEVDSDDNRINITSPAAGSVRVPGGVNIIHRGVFQVVTDQTDFTTVANKTYHLRWNPTNGFVLKDLADSGYNSSNLSEDDESFDTTYDDMLLARVVTNSSNVATITTLANAHLLKQQGEEIAAKGTLGDRVSENSGNAQGQSGSDIVQGTTVTVNYGRKPDVYIRWINDVDTSLNTGEFNFGIDARSRYSLMVWGQGDLNINIGWVART